MKALGAHSSLPDLAEDVSDFPCSKMHLFILFPSAHSLFRTGGESKCGLVSLSPINVYPSLICFVRVLRYVKGAVAETDVPNTLPEFVGQRRRWLNGSFFAATYAIAHVGQLMRSGHSTARKGVLLFETIYNIINMTFAWFSVVCSFYTGLSSSLLILLSGQFLYLLCMDLWYQYTDICN